MKRIIFLSLAPLLFSGCQKGRTINPVTNVIEAAKDMDLQARTFVSNCAVKPLDALVTGLMTGGEAFVKAQQLAYRFDGANVIRQTRLYSTFDCSGDAAFTFEEVGTIKIDKSHKTNDGGYNIEMDFTSLEGLVTTVAGASAANKVKLCGHTDWVINKARDVQAQSQDLMCYAARVPRHVSNIYRVDAGILYLGTQTTGSAYDRDRPSKLDMSIKYDSN